MNHERYERRLLDQEQQLLARIERTRVTAREPGDGSAHDVADESVNDVEKEGQLAAAETDRAVLNQVRAALRRIGDGTFGTCTVDGGPIEKERLEAIPWTPYCLRHQELREQSGSRRTPTL